MAPSSNNDVNAMETSFDVVEPHLPGAVATREQTFKDRKYRLNGNVWLIISVYRNVVCIHIRELEDGWKFQGGVTMNTLEYQWFMCENPPSSGEYGRISVAKQKTGSLIRRIDARMGGSSSSKPRRVFVSHQGFATMVDQQKSILVDIEQATRFAQQRDVNIPTNHQLIKEILILLAAKIYEKRRRAACLACSGQEDSSNVLSHQCLTEEYGDRLELASRCLKEMPSEVLWSVLVCNNLPHPGMDVATIIGDNRGELAEQVVSYKLTNEAQLCFDVYYNANFDIMSLQNDTWEPSQLVQQTC